MAEAWVKEFCSCFMLMLGAGGHQESDCTFD
jgi:hypothetical protein